VDNLLNNIQEVYTIGDGIGDSVASSIVKALQPNNESESKSEGESERSEDQSSPSTRPATTARDLLLKLKAAGVKLSSKSVVDEKTPNARPSSPSSPVPTSEPQEKINTQITGKKLLFTGSFVVSRIDLMNEVQRCGGTLAAVISGSVDYLVVGTDAGPAKVTKAEKLGVKTISEEELKELFKPI